MKRDPVLRQLQLHQPINDHEKQMWEEMIQFIRNNPDCFERTLLKGHVTGSSWIVNPERTHALLLHHFKLDKWLQPGGHCDGDPDVLQVAVREAKEETGVTVTPVNDHIFDVDNHYIPERKDVPAHIHYDIRLLFEAPKEMEELPSNHESRAVRWIKLEDVHLYNNEPAIMRLVEKTK